MKTELHAVAVVVALLIPGTAAAAPTWLPAEPAQETVGVPFNDNRAVMTDDGTVALGFIRDDDSLETIVRPPGGSFGAPQEVAAPATSINGQNFQLQADAAGRLYAIWTDAASGDDAGKIRFAERPPGGVWTAPIIVETAAYLGSNWPQFPKLAVGSGGHVLVAWVEQPAPGENLLVNAKYRAPGGTFGDPEGVASVTGINAQQIAASVNVAGEALVGARFANSVLRASTRSAGAAGTWSDAGSIDGGLGSTGTPAVGLSDAGRAVLVWYAASAGNDVVAARREAGSATWVSATEVRDAAFVNGNMPTSIKFDDAGNAWTVFGAQLTAGGTTHVFAARAEPGSGFAASEQLSPGGEATNPTHRFDVTPAGDVFAAWLHVVSGKARVRYARRPAGAATAFTTGDVLTGDNQTIDDIAGVSADAAGNAVVAFLERTTGLNPTPRRLMILPFDGAGPKLSNVSIPTAGTVGTSLPFSAQAADVWDPTPAFAWSFGDGGTASTLAASHAYATAGTFPASFTATDDSGNASIANGSVVVTGGTTDDDDGEDTGGDGTNTGTGTNAGTGTKTNTNATTTTTTTGGGTAPPAPGPLGTPGPAPPAFSGLSMAARQRPLTRGVFVGLTVGVPGSTVLIEIIGNVPGGRAAKSVVLGRLLKRGARAAKHSFRIRLNRKGKSLVRRRRSMKARVRVTVTPPGGRRVVSTRSITLAR